MGTRKAGRGEEMRRGSIGDWMTRRYEQTCLNGKEFLLS
jgi:hypothetical protein